MTSYGSTITAVPRRPISKDRGRRKGTPTKLDSTPEFQGDLTLESVEDFVEGFVFAEFANVEFDLKSGTVPPPALVTGYTIDAASALLAGKMVYAAAGAITLVYAKGYTNSANNGLKPITADVGATDVLVTVAGLTAETPPTNASLQVAGLRTDDVTLAVAGGGTATLTSAADVNWTVLGLKPGMFVHIGSDAGTGAVQNAYQNTAANDTFGYARITAITTTVLSLDKLDENLTTAGSPYGPVAMDLMFGRFSRNVQVTADADDNRFLERSYQFEVVFPDLGGAGTDEYEYAIGNVPNEMSLDIPLADKAGVTWGFVGTSVDNITGTRKTNAATAVDPLRTTALNTSSNIASISTDVISLVSNVCFKGMTLAIKNNVSPEECLGTLGASFVNSGLFEVSLEGQMLFTDKAIVNAVKNNTTVTFATILANEDGAIGIDIPTMTFGDGSREFPVDQSVLVSITGETFKGDVFDHEIGITLFANVPTTRP